MRLTRLLAWCALIAPAGAAIAGDDRPVAPSVPTPTRFELEGVRPRPTGGNAAADVNDPAHYRDFAEVTAGATKHDGFFTLFQKDEHLYAELKPQQFDQPFLAPIAIARGLQMAGNPLNFGDEWVLVFHRAGDKVQLIRRNVHVKAPSGTPVEKAVQQNHVDSILMALPIVSLNAGNGRSVVIDFADIFCTNFAELPLGSLDRNRTTWHKVKTFANNVELEVQATFGGYGYGYGFGMGGGEGVIDGRGLTVVIHYSLVKLPDSGYKVRTADDRVGHFLNATRDYGSDNPDDNVARSINRWRLEKADPKAKLSPPKRQVVWYIEDTVPLEYRPAVEDGIREWNKAFERIGYRDALSVRWQEPGRDEFDPEDINYCTFRWITSGSTYAMSCLRSNPITGEMIDGDVIFDASWISAWKNEYALLTGQAPTAQGPGAPDRRLAPILGEVVSPMLAARRGFGRFDGAEPTDPTDRAGLLVPAEWSGLQRDLLKRLANGQGAMCRFATGMRPELGIAALTLAATAEAEAEAKKDGAGLKLPDDFLNQLIKEVVMHEVGHSLGLRHNFKASTMLDLDQINDPSITRVKGMVGSVMDYNPINIAPKGQKQGDFITTTIGPYDYWAIEYAYKEVAGDEAAELAKIAAKAPERDLVFATDSDMYAGNDPGVNVFDLGSDPARFARERVALAGQLLRDLDAKVVKDGESWSRLRIAFGYLMAQYGNAADIVATHVGGQSIARDHKGDKDAHDPIVPIPGAKQREALGFLVESIFSDKAFGFSPALLRRLSKENWDTGVGGGMTFGMADVSVNDRVLAIQKVALAHCLAGATLTRLQNQELQADPGTKPLAVAEVFRTLTDGITDELTPKPDGDKPAQVKVSTIRRNLQREYVRRLATIVVGQPRSAMSDLYPYILFNTGGSYPADARALARLHLKEIAEKIKKTTLDAGVRIDDTDRAHLDELHHRIVKVLDAAVTSNEP